MSKKIKIILSILLFLCLANMPYGYFQFVRFAALVGFLLLANAVYQTKRQNEAIVYLALALLFQPFFKIALGRQIWNVVDVVVGLGLILSMFLIPPANKELENRKTDKPLKQ